MFWFLSLSRFSFLFFLFFLLSLFLFGVSGGVKQRRGRCHHATLRLALLWGASYWVVQPRMVLLVLELWHFDSDSLGGLEEWRLDNRCDLQRFVPLLSGDMDDDSSATSDIYRTWPTAGFQKICRSTPWLCIHLVWILTHWATEDCIALNLKPGDRQFLATVSTETSSGGVAFRGWFQDRFWSTLRWVPEFWTPELNGFARGTMYHLLNFVAKAPAGKTGYHCQCWCQLRTYHIEIRHMMIRTTHCNLLSFETTSFLLCDSTAGCALRVSNWGHLLLSLNQFRLSTTLQLWAA